MTVFLRNIGLALIGHGNVVVRTVKRGLVCQDILAFHKLLQILIRVANYVLMFAWKGAVQ